MAIATDPQRPEHRRRGPGGERLSARHTQEKPLKPTADRLPILRFLLLFAGLLAAATGLAALSSAADQAPPAESATRGASAEQAPETPAN
jgi:hypothetical protein